MMQLEQDKKIYFISDFHLGTPGAGDSLKREKHIIKFLNEVESSAAMIFIVGDMFDFWYEYRTVVPRGYTRILGKIADLTDKGIPVHFFVGNHDMWMKDYFQKELNVPVFFEPQEYQFNDKKFLVGHGDGLGPGDYGYKFLKKVFRNPVCQWLFGILPPYFGIGLANWSSRRSRAATGQVDEKYFGEEGEWLITYCKEQLEKQHYDYLVFGHRHLPIEFKFTGKNATYINLGDWIRYDTYAVFDGKNLTLHSYLNKATDKIIRDQN
ncbi:UDP-2,3-diacylglucosamine diphosphatase [Gynurincola endophyticus]|uniref:UDP-2,3-diacylglucosamine diphosphatase n=1 Tax=Gynurincola endophyticus TaxID=2479004 RepID=UPI000F8D0CFD|nr:UDP-2,3-diacylglucosamine diphosphatase [Gynurincola endophyticus]